MARSPKFPVPTVESCQPEIRPGAAKGGKNVLHLEGRDWRQVEFVCAGHAEAARACCERIQEIWGQGRASDGGFLGAHGRDEIPEPLAGAETTVVEAATIFGRGAFIYEGIAVPDWGGWVESPFAMRSPGGIILYGTRAGPSLRYLALDRFGESPIPPTEIEALAAFARAKKLFLINWVNARPIRPTPEGLASFFGADGV